MEPSTRILKASSYAADHDVKYVTTRNESHYFLKASTVEDLIKENGIVEELPPDLDFDYVSDDIKFLVKVDESFYHFFIDCLPIILKLNKEHPGYLLLLYVQSARITRLTEQLMELLTVILDGEGVSYRFIDIDTKYSHSPILKISNFAIVDPYFSGNNSTSFPDVLHAVDTVIKYSKKKLGLENETFAPVKKVFITGETETSFELVLGDIPEYSGYMDDSRMHNRERLEKFFAELGYEIVNPAKDFETLFHQVIYMHQVQTLAAVTCSGLANMIFMNPNQKVMEIQAEIVQNIPASPSDSDGPASSPMQGVHTMYSMLTFMKDHLLVSVPSHRDPDQVIAKLKSSGILENF